jgi:hypothetical protein
MKLVGIEIDGGETKCEKCAFCLKTRASKSCLLFGKSLKDENGSLRLPECLEAETRVCGMAYTARERS